MNDRIEVYRKVATDGFKKEDDDMKNKEEEEKEKIKNESRRRRRRHERSKNSKIRKSKSLQEGRRNKKNKKLKLVDKYKDDKKSYSLFDDGNKEYEYDNENSENISKIKYKKINDKDESNKSFIDNIFKSEKKKERTKRHSSPFLFYTQKKYSRTNTVTFMYM